MADQLFDDYSIGTGSPNLFSGGMSKQELDQLLGLYPVSDAQFKSRASLTENLMADGTRDSGGLNLPDPFLPGKAAPPGTMWELNTISNQYELVANPDWMPVRPYSGTTLATPAPEAASAPALASASLLSGQSDLFPNLKIDSQFSAPALSAPAALAAPTSVMGMFPEVEAMQRALYQQKQNEAMQAQAMQFARLSPFEKASYGLAMGGQQLGGAIGGALGAKDPQMQMIGLQSRILSELIPGNPAQNIQIAQKYATYAPELAMKIYDNALNQNVKIKQASSASKLNVTAKVQEAEAYALKFGAEGSVEYNNAYKTYLQGTEKLSDKQAISNQVSELKANLRVLQKQPQPNPEAIQRIQDQIKSLEPDKQNVTKIGVAKASGKAVYFDEKTDQQFVYGRSPTDPTKQIRVLFEGDVDQTTSNVSATASQKGETAFSEQLGKIDAKQVEDAMSLRNNAISALGTLERLNKLDEQGLISGSFATGRVGASNILATIGLISEKDQGTLAASQNYQKTSGDLVLATLGGRLGSGFSNEDRKFILGLVPQLETNALARKQLIEFMVKKNRDIITETTRLDDYARDNKSLKGFVPKIPIFNVSSGERKSTKDMTKQELLDEKAEILRNKK